MKYTYMLALLCLMFSCDPDTSGLTEIPEETLNQTEIATASSEGDGEASDDDAESHEDSEDQDDANTDTEGGDDTEETQTDDSGEEHPEDTDSEEEENAGDPDEGSTSDSEHQTEETENTGGDPGSTDSTEDSMGEDGIDDEAYEDMGADEAEDEEVTTTESEDPSSPEISGMPSEITFKFKVIEGYTASKSICGMAKQDVYLVETIEVLQRGSGVVSIPDLSEQILVSFAVSPTDLAQGDIVQAVALESLCMTTFESYYTINSYEILD